MRVREVELPGVGKKFVLTLHSGDELVIVAHLTGTRELFLFPQGAEEPSAVIALSDAEAREVAMILGGAVYEPTPLSQAEMVLSGLVIEWLTVAPRSPLAGRSIAQLQIRKRTGVSVIAIQRGTQIIPNPDPSEQLQVGDLLLLVGTGQQMRQFQKVFEVAPDQ
ncbi:K(+)/H(+) antiporter subunit KhtT [bacterium HR17]|jgi:TrkA domain protein|uniref:K(+)/H(+) antiporter subunit KhtT n=1 Tax=Candidatus Fervidibacter japonicus TaxID=2035412 RepID=A0A2H5XEE5_9BACT|nr:K(+)/H(+) antiporter subunit KhtT [bacterium HR17]